MNRHTVCAQNGPNRRHLLAGGLGFVSLAASKPTRGQTPRRIGMLTLQAPGSLDLYLQYLDRGLADLSYKRGANLLVIERYANGRADTLKALVAELLAERVELIIVQGAATLELKAWLSRRSQSRVRCVRNSSNTGDLWQILPGSW